MRGEYLELHRNRTLLNVLAERLDVEVAVDLRQTVMDLVAVFLDRRAVRSVLDGHELLQNIGQLVVSVCYAEDDEASVQWREMMWGAREREDASVSNARLTWLWLWSPYKNKKRGKGEMLKQG